MQAIKQNDLFSIPPEEKLTRIMRAICRREERRVALYVKNNPLMANASVGWNFNTRAEMAVMHHCQQLLMINYPDKSPSQAREDNRRVVLLAKKLGIRRSQARKMLKIKA